MKATSPQASASYISLLLFSWLDPLVWAGWKRPLRQHDLPAVSQEVIAFSVMGCNKEKYDNTITDLYLYHCKDKNKNKKITL